MLCQVIDILATIAFAISGASVAMNKRLDVFGVLIVAFVAAAGGGTLRDLLIGQAPVAWMINMHYAYAIVGATFFTIVFQNKINYLRMSLFLFDTIGIG